MVGLFKQEATMKRILAAAVVIILAAFYVAAMGYAQSNGAYGGKRIKLSADPRIAQIGTEVELTAVLSDHADGKPITFSVIQGNATPANSATVTQDGGVANSAVTVGGAGVVRVKAQSTGYGSAIVTIYVLNAGEDIALTIFRLEGQPVPDDKKRSQGSIVNVFDPFRSDASYDPPNHGLLLQVSIPTQNFPDLTWSLKEIGPDTDRGRIMILQGAQIIKSDLQNEVPINAGENGQLELAVIATRSGVVDLALIGKQADGTQIFMDFVRITGIPNLPSPGRIIFVNKNATSHDAPFDDFLENAANTISEAVAEATEGDNVVIAANRYEEYDINVNYGMTIAGLGGRHACWMPVTKYDLRRAPVISACGYGRVFDVHLNLGQVRIGGLRLRNGVAETGGLIHIAHEENAEGDHSYRLEFCELKYGYAFGQWEDGIPDFDLVDGALQGAAMLDDEGEVQPGPAQVKGGGHVKVHGKRGTTLVEGTWAINSRVLFMGGRAEAAGGFYLLIGDPDVGRVLNSANSIISKLEAGQPVSNIGNPSDFVLFNQCDFQQGVARQGGAIASLFKEDSSSPWPPTSWEDKRHFEKMMTGGYPFIAQLSRFMENKARSTTGGNQEEADKSPSPRGGAIFLWGSGCMGTQLKGCLLWGNQAPKSGGAIAVIYNSALATLPYNGESTIIEENSVTGVSGKSGGGGISVSVFAIYQGFSTIIRNNTSAFAGGGVHVTSGAVASLDACTIRGNKAEAKHGGGIYLRNARLDVSRSLIYRNTAASHGGGICVHLSDDSLQDGTTPQSAGAEQYGPTGANSTIVRFLDGTQLVNNTAAVCGGFYAFREVNSVNFNVNDKVLSIILDRAIIDDNVATQDDSVMGKTSGIGWSGTDESSKNRPSFDRGYYIDEIERGLHLNFRRWIPLTDLWPDNNTRRPMAVYLARLNLFNLTDEVLATDRILNSTIRGITPIALDETWRFSTANGDAYFHKNCSGNSVDNPEKVRPIGFLGPQSP
jgi:hypothetical protein